MISQVLIRNVVPADSVVESANALVRSKNELKQKEVEVQTAQAESRRMAALANNSGASHCIHAGPGHVEHLRRYQERPSTDHCGAQQTSMH
jgi:hypothetical protein